MSCALPLVLASAPRVYLRYNIKTLRNLSNTVSKAIHTGPETSKRQTLLNLTSILETSAIRISQVDRVLLEVDTIIKTAYETAGVVGAARAAAEKELLLEARVPPSLNPVVDQLLSRIMDGLRKEIDRAELYFADFSWLGLTPEDGRKGSKRKLIDALRKVPLKEGTPLRRCTRCCAVMQDGMQPGVLWLTQMQRSCVCGSLWMIMD